MIDALRGIAASDAAPVEPAHIATALTAAPFVFDDGARQVFRPDGTTTYVERGRDSFGEWSVDRTGHYCSFWPPSFRACYDLSWIVEGGAIVGLRFTALQGGSRFDGRYQPLTP